MMWMVSVYIDTGGQGGENKTDCRGIRFDHETPTLILWEIIEDIRPTCQSTSNYGERNIVATLARMDFLYNHGSSDRTLYFIICSE